MKVVSTLVLIFVFTVVCHSAILDPKSRHFSHGDEGDLEHNSNFDHEAFLDKDGAQEFGNLSPEESRRRLSLLVKKIDKDGDGKVTTEELQEWVAGVQERYILRDVNRMWMEFLGEADAELITFETYKEKQYGPDFDENAEPDAQAGDHNDHNDYKMYKRDVRRWGWADRDGDGHLTKGEFAFFMHPEDSREMAELTALETIEEIDKDLDGKISLSEYIDDLWPNPDKRDDEPDWVKNERDLFQNFRDKDVDGLMDLKEVVDWITPSDYDPHQTEARHLIYEADADHDGVLTENEILDKYDIFVGSQATDFGEALNAHDEF